VNWAGDQAVSMRELCEYIASIIGVKATFQESSSWPDFFLSDNTRREQLVGKCEVHWKDGIRELVEHRLGVVTA
jgi:hypothetical protein